MTTQPPDQAPELQPDARLGEVFDERYRIVAHLGTGGMASVYRAEHLAGGAEVAIKVLHPSLTDNAEISGRFRREASAARSIRHPNVVSVFDIGRLPDGCSYMVLEYIPGEDLCLLLHREKPLAQARAVKIALQVASALVGAHAAGVVHRDLKPDNIMLIAHQGDRDFVKVVDFGIAKVAAQGGPVLTVLGSIFGTPEYMAPEQAKGAAVDARTDLYTLGTVLYEMLVGRTPFAHALFPQVLMGQLTKPPPPLPPEIDPELIALVMQLLEKEPAKRVQTAADLCVRLQSLLARLAPHHPALAAAAPLAPSQPSASAPLPSQPVAAAGPPAQAFAPAPAVVASPSLRANAAVPMQSPTAPTRAGAATQRPPLVGYAIAVVVFLVAALVLVRWLAAMF